MTVDPWKPDLYQVFAAERARPAHDLIALLQPTPHGRAVDLGCGTGELTVSLAEHIGAHETIGIDGSPAMLERADAHRSSTITFREGDLSHWEASTDPVDAIFANASLHWISDHQSVLRRWTASLRPGGQLAVQVPANADHPSHLVAVETALEPEFAEALAAHGGPPADPVATNVLTPERYAELLFDLGFVDQHVRLGVYGPILSGPADIAAWTRGTTLTRFERLLPPETFERFVDRYTERLVERIGDRTPYFFSFKRILFWARLPG